MQNENIKVKDYTKLMHFFNPTQFNAHDWVSMAENDGMKYITLITRHHDGFSMWNTKYSDFNIMNTRSGSRYVVTFSLQNLSKYEHYW